MNLLQFEEELILFFSFLADNRHTEVRQTNFLYPHTHKQQIMYLHKRNDVS